MDQFIFSQFQKMIEATMTVGEHASDVILEAAQCLSSSLLNGNRVLVLGDDECAPLSQLLCNYLHRGLEFERPGFPALNLNQLTAGDGNTDRFAEMLQLHGQPGDALLVMSSGNNDLSLLGTLEVARNNELNIVLLCNNDDGVLIENLGYNDVQVNLGELTGTLLIQAQVQVIQCACATIDKLVFGAE